MKLISTYKNATTHPWPCGFMASCYLSSMEKSLGIKDRYYWLYNFLDDKGSDWFFDQEEIGRIAPKVVAALLRDPGLIQKCGREYLKRIKSVLRLLDAKKVLARLDKMDDKAIYALLKKAVKTYNQAGYYVEPPDFSIELGGQHIVKDMLRSHLKEAGYGLKPSDADALFGQLSGFTKLSFSQRAEVSLLKICLLPEHRREAAIRKHAQEFYWQFYDYYGPILTEKEVEEELKAYKDVPPHEIRKRIQDISGSAKRNAAEQKTAEAKYGLGKELRTAFKVLRDFGHLYSDVKKEMTSKANIALNEVLHHVAARHGLDAYLIHYASLQEIWDLLDSGKAMDEKILKERSRGSILQCLPPEDGYYRFLSPDEERSVKASVAKADNPLGQLKGMPACSGKYQGKVRVVKNASQISKFEQGEVLVAPYTVVNYLPAMRKAGAIVTDLGGITCHAAIVSRELGIPCVIGTKVATKVFKDGDVVEVDANHGVVKLIK